MRAAFPGGPFLFESDEREVAVVVTYPELLSSGTAVYLLEKRLVVAVVEVLLIFEAIIRKQP